MEILNIAIRVLRHVHSVINRLEVAANNAAKITRHFSIKTRIIEKEIHLHGTVALIQLALSDLNHDLTNLKLGFQEMLETFASSLIIPDDAFLTIIKHASLNPKFDVPFGASIFICLQRHFHSIYETHGFRRISLLLLIGFNTLETRQMFLMYFIFIP